MGGTLYFKNEVCSRDWWMNKPLCSSPYVPRMPGSVALSRHIPGTLIMRRAIPFRTESRATSFIPPSSVYAGKLQMSWSAVKWTAEAAWKSNHLRANVHSDRLRWRLPLKNPCPSCVMGFLLGPRMDSSQEHQQFDNLLHLWTVFYAWQFLSTKG